MSQPSAIASSTAVAHLLLGDAASCDIRNTDCVPLRAGRRVILQYDGDGSIWVNDGTTATRHQATVGSRDTACASVIFPSSVKPSEGGGYSAGAGNKITLPANQTITVAHHTAWNPACHPQPFTQCTDGSLLSQDGDGPLAVSVYPSVQWGPQAGTRVSTGGTST